jgi:hypothetical protein
MRPGNSFDATVVAASKLFHGSVKAPSAQHVEI